MQSYQFVFTDLETTGHEPLRQVDGTLVQWHEIIEIGVVRINPATLKVTGTFEQKIKPSHPERCVGEPAKVTKYHERADGGEWNSAVSLKQGMDNLFAFLREEPIPILGNQNYFFDDRFLMVALVLAGYTEDDWKNVIHYSRFDTRSMAIQELWMPGTPFNPNDWSARNKDLVKKLGVKPEPDVHGALNGARQACEIFCALEKIKRQRNKTCLGIGD